MGKITAFYMPETLSEAQELLKSEENMILGGGTSLSKTIPGPITGLISLKKVGLDKIESNENGFQIGAKTRVQDVLKHEELSKKFNGILAKACRNIGSSQTRNLVSVAGNIVGIYPWSDLPPVLLILDGNVVTATDEKVSFGDFFSELPVRQKFGREKIVKAIEILNEKPGYAYFWETLQKTKVDYAMTTICGGVLLEDGKVKDIKLSVSAISILPKRLKKAEEKLQGKELTEENVNLALEEQFADFSIKTDYRASQEYLKEVTQNLLRKNLLGIQEGGA